MKRVVILGGGIAGLTVAHELAKHNYRITLFEKFDKLGGIARSSHESCPSEVSWRGFGQFYENLFSLMREIPYNNKSVYDDLFATLESEWENPAQKIREKWGGTTCENGWVNEGWNLAQFNIRDKIVLCYNAIKWLLNSNERNISEHTGQNGWTGWKTISIRTKPTLSW